MRRPLHFDRRAMTSSLRRAGRGLAIATMAGLLASSCSSYFWSAPKSWAFKGQLASVSESAPHGTLVLERNSEHIYIIVDGKAAFRTVEGSRASFRLPPGRHEVAAMYSATEGNSAVASRAPLKGSFELREGGTVRLGVVSTGSGIRFVQP